MFLQRIVLGACVLALIGFAGPVHAQDPDPDAAAQAKMQNDMQTAVTKGIRWLTSQQQPDGSWSYDNRPLQLPGSFPMRSGVTALCAFALMKCGIGPDEPAVRKAFELIHKDGFKWTYEVGCILLALEAKANFDPSRQPIQAPGAAGLGTTTQERGKDDKKNKKKKKKKGKADPRDRKLAQACVDWLIETQREAGLWRYSAGSDEDVSNAQYAMLGLDAAERMGIKVPKGVYAKAAKRLVEIQHPVLDSDKGKVIKPFPVPGADHSYKALKKIEAQLLRDIKKVDSSFRKLKDGERDKKGYTRKEAAQTAERKAAEKITSGTEKLKMEPRGWTYFAPGTGGTTWQRTVSGSLTCSALASLFICKARLEGTPMWSGELNSSVNKALRDGCAWLSINFAVNRNPGLSLHQLYYLYGLERAGVLGLVHRFGDHEWFDKGARHLLRQQRGGSWMGTASTSGPVPDTCFALLFLSRGTTPVVKIPGRVMTGVKR